MSKRNPFNVQMTEREKELMAPGRPVVCPVCREVSALFPKAVGFHPYQWEMNCSLCHRYDVGLDAYVAGHREVVEALCALRERYIEGESTAELAGEVGALAGRFDAVLSNAVCECGGRLSIAAKPKCIFCDVEVFDSYFHVADQPVDRDGRAWARPAGVPRRRPASRRAAGRARPGVGSGRRRSEAGPRGR
jgi:hypothetical protein